MEQKINYITSHLFSANGITKPYAPVMVLKKFDNSSVYKVMQKNGNTFYASEFQLEKIKILHNYEK
jgi:hypothetical protein|tara:strand:+ start:488 stop:685 length:198 start_codon:yes stop_codon:yes gene_type:complete